MGSRVRVRTLTSDGQASAVSKTAVAADVHQALDVHGPLCSERTLDLETALDLTAQTIHVVVVEILRPAIGINSTRGDDLLRPHVPNTVDVRESDFDTLASRQINTSDTCHDLTLALFMLGITGADDAYYAFAA